MSDARYNEYGIPVSELKQTRRGFGYYEFTDSGGEKCNIQKSSSGMGTFIWFGIPKLKVEVCIPGPWRTIEEQDIKTAFNCRDVVASTRMHLNQEQVAALIPILQRFVDTGEI